MSGAVFDVDVAIVGGGPAGSSTALHLVRGEGVRADRIVVLDKAKFPREKPCAGAISQIGVDALADVGVAVDVPFVTMRGVRVLDGDACGETFAPMGIVVRRSEFDAALLGVAKGEGVDVRDGDGLKAIERVTGGFRLTTTGGDVLTARLLAACDGAGSTSRKLLGIREAERKGHLYVLETKPVPADTGTPRGLVDFDLSVRSDGLQGYYWDFPTVIDGSEHVSRGIYHANFDKGGEVKESLARALEKRGIDIRETKLKPFSTRPFVRTSTTWVDRVVLVGEAAGIDHTTGEGIAQAIVMGKMAARHLARAVRTGGHAFEGYEREVFASTIGRHMLQSAWLARRAYGPRSAPFRRYLLASDYARAQAMKWYRGEKLSLFAQLRLGVGLATSALS